MWIFQYGYLSLPIGSGLIATSHDLTPNGLVENFLVSFGVWLWIAICLGARFMIDFLLTMMQAGFIICSNHTASFLANLIHLFVILQRLLASICGRCCTKRDLFLLLRILWMSRMTDQFQNFGQVRFGLVTAGPKIRSVYDLSYAANAVLTRGQLIELLEATFDANPYWFRRFSICKLQLSVSSIISIWADSLRCRDIGCHFWAIYVFDLLVRLARLVKYYKLTRSMYKILGIFTYIWLIVWWWM